MTFGRPPGWEWGGLVNSLSPGRAIQLSPEW